MHICICLQPGNSDLFKGHGLASPEGGAMDWAAVTGGGASPTGR